MYTLLKGSSLVHTIGFLKYLKKKFFRFSSQRSSGRFWTESQRRPSYGTSPSLQQLKRFRLHAMFKNSLATTTSASIQYRCYRVETAGALKNIIAVGAGALHGLGYGDNAKVIYYCAALKSRALALSSS